MNKFDRIKLAISGDKQSTIPFSFWTHLPEIDRLPKEVAQATYDMYKQYDLDFIKTMNNGMYAVEDYRTQVDFSDGLIASTRGSWSHADWCLCFQLDDGGSGDYAG